MKRAAGIVACPYKRDEASTAQRNEPEGPAGSDCRWGFQGADLDVPFASGAALEIDQAQARQCGAGAYGIADRKVDDRSVALGVRLG